MPHANTVVHEETSRDNTCTVHDIAESGLVLGSLTYIARELHMLKQYYVDLPPLPSDKDISRVDKDICETTLVQAEGLPYT